MDLKYLSVMPDDIRPKSEPAKPGSLERVVRLAAFDRISRELDRAYEKHGRDQWGRHEFYAILKEEVDELWDAIKADKPQEDVRDEAIQIAAMVFRYLETGDRYREPNAALCGGTVENPKP